MPDAKLPSMLSTTRTHTSVAVTARVWFVMSAPRPDSHQRAERRRGDPAGEHDEDVGAVRAEVDVPLRQPRQGDGEREQ